MSEEVSLVIEDKSYMGWKDVRILRSLDHLSASFSLGLIARWPGESIPVMPGKACRISIAGEPVLTGFIDTYEWEVSRSTRLVRINGRDKAGDLVDCSHPGPFLYRNIDLFQLTLKLTEQFNIDVVVKTEIGAPFSFFAIHEGELLHEILARAAKRRNILMTSSPAGALVLEKSAEHPVTTLEFGKNLLEIKGHRSFKERYSDYILKGRRRGDDWTVASDLVSLYTYKDTEIPRFRPLFLHCEGNAARSDLEKRAQWEANVRRGRGMALRVTVPGWTYNGTLWAPNTLITYKDAPAGLDFEALVVDVTLVLDGHGRRTELKLVRPSAYLPAPPTRQDERELGW